MVPAGRTTGMQLDLHISRFDWAGGPSGIGPGVAALAGAEAADPRPDRLGPVAQEAVPAAQGEAAEEAGMLELELAPVEGVVEPALAPVDPELL